MRAILWKAKFDRHLIPLARSLVYLVAVLDWHSLRALAHRFSITTEADFCVEALTEAVSRSNPSQIMSTNLGIQFTGTGFINGLHTHDVAISRGDRGQWRDNVFAKRL